MLKCVAVVDRGKIHTTNDDAALIQHSVIHEGIFMGNYGDECICAVADGVGGLEQSELASRAVLRVLSECNARLSSNVYDCIVTSNSEIMKICNRMDLETEISTTLCAVSILGNRFISYNVGNSRLYQFRKKYLRQLTKDHTRVQELYENGMISYKQLSSHVDKNIITRYVGGKRFEPSWIDVVEHDEVLEEGDVLLLCSDGVHEYVSLDDMELILQMDTNLLTKASSIIEVSLDAGGKDNATVVLISKQ